MRKFENTKEDSKFELVRVKNDKYMNIMNWNKLSGFTISYEIWRNKEENNWETYGKLELIQ